jgi:phosphatidate cytidylyltransferase
MGGKVPLWMIVMWAGVLSVMAQFGDLAESLLKRAGEIKDSGIFFGHMGGILDVVDSLLLCAPSAYILAVIAGFKLS